MEDIKSIRSSYSVTATFKNKSERWADLYWIDFQGGLVLYRKDVEPGTEFILRTYVTHPWVARDSVTGQRLWLSGQPVYVTAMPEGRQQDREDQKEGHVGPIFVGSVEIVVHIPAYRLEEICIGFLRKHLNASKLTGLHLSQYLLDRLSHIPKPPARVYQPHGAITDDNGH